MTTIPLNIKSIYKVTLMLGILVTTKSIRSVSGNLNENERMEEFHRRGHTWPPKLEDYKPSTPGWKAINDKWFDQLQYSAEESSDERYQAYMSAVHSALISKNFTQYGWGITKAPKAVVDKLKKRLHDGLNKEEKKFERPNPCTGTDLLPYYMPDYKMNKEIVEDMLPFMESWSGVELHPNNAYGLRVYRNNTNLLMHLDKPATHVISGILHIDHGENDEPWPLVIEDFHGNTNEVYLESGDLLFYESSKCRHGRPTKYNGEFYSSLFMHYYPKDWVSDDIRMDVHYRIPDSHYWAEPSELPEDKMIDFKRLTIQSLCLKQTECEHDWCGMKETLKWKAQNPGFGKVLSGDGIVHELKNIPNEEAFGNTGNHDEL